jgi:L-ascorbate metabolism protein UlaG (beta-lactamase superfamily)
MTATDLHLPTLGDTAGEPGGAVTFIGTATVLVRYETLTFLTDPNFLHAGDHAHLGYGLRSERLTDPALELSALPPLDFVLLSHHHGDHFDQLVERQLDRSIPIITEPGSAKRLRKLGFRSTYPLATWESITVRRGLQWLTVTAMPARHARGPVAALLPSVMGSMLRFGHGDGDPEFHMYITGDTLLVDELAEIGRRHPELKRLRLIVTREAEADAMTLAAETAAATDALKAAVGATLQDLTKLKGAVDFVVPGSLPNDGKVISDERKID